jgi:hypothetical protein
MPKSQRGVAVSEGLRTSARARQCPGCGRYAALVHVDLEGVRYADGTVEITRRAVVCRWARDSAGRLCTWPGESIGRDGPSPAAAPAR